MGRVCYVLGKITNSFWAEQASHTIFFEWQPEDFRRYHLYDDHSVGATKPQDSVFLISYYLQKGFSLDYLLNLSTLEKIFFYESMEFHIKLESKKLQKMMGGA